MHVGCDTTTIMMQAYEKAIEQLKKLYRHQFDMMTAESLSPYLRRSVQKWDQHILRYVALNCHLHLCSVFSDVEQNIVGKEFAVVTWGAPTNHDKVKKGEGLRVCIPCSYTCVCVCVCVYKYASIHTKQMQARCSTHDCTQPTHLRTHLPTHMIAPSPNNHHAHAESHQAVAVSEKTIKREG